MSTTKRIAIQGVRGAFHEVAARNYFGNDITIVECQTFKDLCDAVDHNRADYAVMAIENTIAGSLLQNYSLIRDYHLKVRGEVYLHIQMNLMALPGTTIKDLEFIHSHPIAIRQCAEYLWGLKGVTLVDTDDTAASAKKIAEEQLPHVAAVANEACAALYGLEILERRIETNKKNFTRFLVLGTEVTNSRENNKASISLQLGHQPGSLAKVLNLFHEHQINLTKIQSVPIIGKPYEYSFYIDLEWSDYDHYEQALHALLQTVSHLAILGEYQKGDMSKINHMLND